MAKLKNELAGHFRVVCSYLRATSYRFERGDHKYEHMLDGDGYVCAFSFSDDGRMHFRSAYVKTR